MVYVLGIDGGGTKTTGVIANEKGEVIAEATVGASNLNSVGRYFVEKELTKLMKSLNQQIGGNLTQIQRVFAGMSGAGDKDTRKELQQMITSLVPACIKVTVDHDAITALYSGTLGKPGVVQIAGTGAISFGENKHGNRGRVGGWGYLFNDHGSGYSIGRDGLKMAFLAYDGLGKSTCLQELFVNHFGAQDLPDIIPMIYQDKNPRELIASLSKLVVKATDDGDSVAKEIIKEKGVALGHSIVSLVNQLFTEEINTESIPVVLVGGVFNRLDLFQKTIEELIEANHMNVRINVPKILPVGGAIIAALMKEKIKINKDFTTAFNKGYRRFYDER